jgi:hypothetical protein
MVIGMPVDEPETAELPEMNVAVKEYVVSWVGIQGMLAVAPAVPAALVVAEPISWPAVLKNCTPPEGRVMPSAVLIATLRVLYTPICAVVPEVKLIELVVAGVAADDDAPSIDRVPITAAATRAATVRLDMTASREVLVLRW